MINYGLYVLSDVYMSTLYPFKYPQDKNVKRPFYLAIQDDDKEHVYWCIPLSSKIDKYKSIIKEKPNAGIIAYLYGDSDSVILTQNIVPVPIEYIEREFTLNNIHFVIKDSILIDEISKKAKKIIALIKYKEIKFFENCKKLYCSL